MTETRKDGAIARAAASNTGVATCCFVVAALCYCGQFGMFLILPLVIVTPWLVLNLIQAARYPAQRRARLIRCVMWIVTLSALIGWHDYRAQKREALASDTARRVEAFRSAHERYPTIEDLGWSRQTAWRAGILYLYDPKDAENPQPLLGYVSEWDPFDRYFYRFDTRTWEFHAD